MSRSCQRATSSRPGAERSRAAPGPVRSAARTGSGCACAAWPSCPSGRRRRLLDLAHLGAGQVADLGGDQLDRGAHRGAGVEVLGVAVAGDHLGGRHRVRARAPRRRGPRPRGRCWSRCPTAPESLPTATRPRAVAQPLAVPVGLQGPQGELGPEGRGLGVHAVGAPGHGDVDELAAPGPPAPPPARRGGQQQVGGRGQGGAQGGVDDVRGREAVVDPRALGLADARPGPRRRRRPRRGR